MNARLTDRQLAHLLDVVGGIPGEGQPLARLIARYVRGETEAFLPGTLRRRDLRRGGAWLTVVLLHWQSVLERRPEYRDHVGPGFELLAELAGLVADELARLTEQN